MGAVLEKLRDVFFSSKMEIVLVGLENSGKTTFVNYLNVGRHLEEAPTVGMNVKVMKKGGVTLKVWDIGGQKQYRSEWARYTRGCNVIAFVVDTQTPQTLHVAKKELHQLLEDRELAVSHHMHACPHPRPLHLMHSTNPSRAVSVAGEQKLPLLVLANKIDLGPKISEQELIRGLNLDYVVDNPWVVIPISAKNGANIDKALDFLIKASKK